jgi:hypothetical protein
LKMIEAVAIPSSILDVGLAALSAWKVARIV